MVRERLTGQESPAVAAPGLALVREWIEQKTDLDALRRDFEQLVTRLKLAKALDVATGQPDCEMEEKVALIKRISELVGVSLEDVFDE